MKASLEQVPFSSDSSFLVREFDVPYFEAPLHFHPVFELTLITGSNGKRFIGDNIGDFAPGDLVFMGPDLPHFYRCSEAYYATNTDHRAKAIIIQFAESFLGKDFFSVPEMKNISKLFTESMKGISYEGKTNKEIIKRMMDIRFMEGFEKLNQLLSILDILSHSDEYKALSRQGLIGYNPKDNERMNKIYEYVMANFTNSISLKKVAEKANMSEAAFCRYFRKKTRKTFTFFLNEIRIAYACKLLLEDNFNVAEICYYCGFENISNFNRHFKTFTSFNPLSYKEQFKKLLPCTTEFLVMK